jgi:dTDP-4-amino-4,6-dideoxygalactose transaminase
MNNDPLIPFMDLASPHRRLEQDLVKVFRRALKTSEFIGRSLVKDFEEDFARFCSTAFCVGVGSGTDALRFALMAAGVKKNDLVVTVPNTFIATTEAISQAGASPVFVDIDAASFNMDPEMLRQFLESECRYDGKSGHCIHQGSGRQVSAVVPVHLYGRMADMDPILDLGERYGLMVIEDACQAHGAEYFSQRRQNWVKAGSVGAAAAFSFYPGKNLGACGEAGAVTTDDEEIAHTVRMLRDHGQSRKYHHELEGYNGRLDAIQAGIISVKLRHLPRWNEMRRRNAFLYNLLLSDCDGVVLPREDSNFKSVYHLYVIRAADRDGLLRHLGEHRISTGLHYPKPLHLQKAYRTLGIAEGRYPVSEKAAGEILSLPMYPELLEEQIETVSNIIVRFCQTP